jgi:DNA mismatch repair protein MutL
MGKIQLLDEHIANQIAAGEVVERPSSVVKELVENAIDAGSTRIDVTIEEGGLQLIRVADNGSGMEPDDCETAFQRHATSKIATSKDLFAIRTLGFRGEALPSIAAVSKLACTTSARTDGLGRRIVIEGGAVREVADAAAERGTDIVVRELFYNTPARLKYMKSIQTELGHVPDYIYRLAIAHPHIAFTLRHNGHPLLQTLGSGDGLQALAAIYGTALAKQMLPVQAESLDYRLRGHIAKPEVTRANRGGITVIVNGRYIRNYAVSQALLQGYHTLLPINRFPVAALHLEMDPVLVDVNVHPSKLEVRFSKEAELMELIEHTVRAALGNQVLIPQMTKQPAPKPAVVQEQMTLYRPLPQTDEEGAAAQRPSGMGDSFASYGSAPASGSQSAEPLSVPLQADPYSSSDASHRPQGNGYVHDAPGRPYAKLQPPAEEGRMGMVNSQGGGRIGPEPGSEPFRQASNALLETMQPAPDALPALPAFPRLQPIGQLHGTYLVAQNEEGLFLVDQHAAHERINYELFYEKFGRPGDASQELLIPLTFEFTSADAGRLLDKLPLLSQVGVVMEPFGGGAFRVRSLPHWFPQGEEQAIVEEMCDWLLAGKLAIDIAKLREKASILCSCKASIKANQRQSLAELEALLDRLAVCRNPYTCPHGRPIVVSFSTYELEKMFKRVM